MRAAPDILGGGGTLRGEHPHGSSHLPKRILRAIAIGLGALVAFVIVALIGVLVFIDTGPGRRLTVAEVNKILAPQFQGQIRIERLRGLGPTGLSGADVTIDDPSGRQVAVIRGLDVTVATLRAARTALFGKRDPIVLSFSDISIDSIDALLDTDPNGQLYLAQTFASRQPPSPPNPNARPLRIELRRLYLRHGTAHGTMSGAPPLDVQLDELRGEAAVAPDSIEADIASATIAARRIVNGGDVAGTIVAHLKMPSDPKVLPEGRLSWRGSVARAAEAIDASLVAGKLDAVVDAPAIGPEAIRTLWPDSPANESAKLHLEAHGMLPDVALALSAAVGETTLTIAGHARVADEKSATLTIEARDVDAREFAAGAPPSRLALSGKVAGRMAKDGAATANADLDFQGGALGATVLPKARLRASIDRPDAHGLKADADLTVEEPGAPTHLTVSVRPAGDSLVASFALDSKADDLDQVPQLAHAMRGRADVEAHGTVSIDTMAIDADLAAHASNIASNGAQVASATLVGHAEGRIPSPRTDLRVSARGVVAAGRRFDSIDVAASGPAMRPHVTASIRGPDAPSVDAALDLALSPAMSAKAITATLSRAGERATLHVDEVTIEAGRLRIDRAGVDGIGTLSVAEASIAPEEASWRAKAEGLDLGRVGRLAHLENDLKAGTVSFDSNMVLYRGASHGQSTLDVAGVWAAGLQNLSAHLDASLEGRRLKGKLHADAASIGQLDVDIARLDDDGPQGWPSVSWKQMTGSVDAQGHLDLGRLTAVLPPQANPFSEAAGTVTFKGHVTRNDLLDTTPDLALVANTDQLVLAAKSGQARDIDGVMVYPPPAWRLSDFDLDVDLKVDGRSGAVDATTRAHDVHGKLAELHVTTPHFPLADVLENTGELRAHLLRTPFSLDLSIPTRGLGKVPPLFQQSYVTGRLQADLHVAGTALVPTVTLKAKLSHSSVAPDRMTLPPSVDVLAHYDGRRGDVAMVGSKDEVKVIDLKTNFDFSVDQALQGTGAPQWSASARAHLDRFAMQSITTLDNKLVAGLVTGDLAVTGLHKDARAEATLTIDGLRVGSVPYKSAQIRAKADGHALDANVHIDQTDGFADLDAHVLASWGDAPAPVLDPNQPLILHMSAKGFRIAAVQPFFAAVFDELDGRLDADAHVTLDPATRSAKVDGQIGLRRGVIEAVAGGGEIHDLSADVKLSPDGVIVLQKLSGAGLVGRFEADGSARLNGLKLVGAKATIVIPSKSAIPLDIGGSELGNIDGRFEVAADTTSAGALAVNVNVPHIRVALQEGSSGTGQALGDLDKVRIGAHRGNPATFVLLPLDPGKPKEQASDGGSSAPMTIKTDLRDVEVIRGRDLKIDMNGQVNVESGATSEVTGQIRLVPGGQLSVQGKSFTIEGGTVTFVGGDPSNPQVVVRAGWTSPDGTLVHAAFIGPLKTGKVTLSSEPPLSKQEIVEELLYGTSDGNQTQTPSANTENTAVGTVGGEAAQPLNHMFDQLGLGSVSASVDTSESANPKPEVEVQVARDIALQIAVVLGQPPPGVNPDHTLLTLDWRFLKKWSLSSTVGDAGTTIFDLLWQKRY